jgi:MFS family permease
VSTPTSPFAIRDYRFYWFARLLSTIAQMAMVIVIGWQVYDIARQTMDIQAAAFQLGLIGLVQFAPLFLLTLVSGWTADRIDRRYIARAVLALEMLCAAILFWATWTGIISLPILFGVAALLGVARAFAGGVRRARAQSRAARDPAQGDRHEFDGWQSGSIAGPAIGGLLYDITPHLPYAVSTVLFGISLVAVLMIRPISRSRSWGRRARGVK